MAAAVAGQTESLVTWNAKDFDCGFIRKHAIKIMNPDEYLCALYGDFPDEVVATIAKLAASKRRPPMMPVDLSDALDRAGVKGFASLVRSHQTRADDLPELASAPGESALDRPGSGMPV
jgi:hypothetical protein